MQKFISRLKPYSVFIIFCIAIIFFLPQNLSKAPESERNAIITTIGIDRIDDNYSLSLLVFIPTASREFVETYDLVKIEGKTIGEAIEKAEKNLGKQIEFYHTKNLIIGNNAQDYILTILNYFVEEKTLPFSSMLVGTDLSANDFLSKIHKENGNPTQLINEIMVYSSKNIYYNRATLEDFFSGYYGDVSSSFIGVLNLNETDDASSKSIGGQKENKSSIKEINNTENLWLIKNGKVVYTLTSKEAKGIVWLQNEIKEEIVIVNEDGYNVVYHIDDKKVTKKTKFINDSPILSFDLTIHIDKKEEDIEKEKKFKEKNISEAEENLVKEKIKDEISTIINALKDHKVDILGIYKCFYKEERNKFKKYLEGLESVDDFMQKMAFEVNINVLDD